ncbi:putative Pre-mRNA-splicing factor CEF1 [Blattamonas nauphoetae]|uniref:Pre-mRNA-splicing factor CEF1 n=1 Tax=Blattamonas nauphoetae TaxID=2049346 RepID=A0ABQ9YLI8_9EUKA|nr:putative Pre-mRNA-splicing factor CEF1 [Blattamonas nauphoetae]
MKILFKGGVWKNSEDEVLKAAVMKYGKNQWSRISSLLVRKTAKQCKARWFEWLDPSIKKTEWTREEEEKLLHLAKVMPSQWRTISQIIKRPPAMCMEHYDRLLDAALGREDGEDAENDPRRLRPGEIDPNPEGKPAKPDPVDMDDDEKEMLVETIARLANTKGKKAKRRARERQLEEARRLTLLQKRRELKAAGIEVGLSDPLQARRKKKIQSTSMINLEKEIPFLTTPMPGQFNTTGEKMRTPDEELIHKLREREKENEQKERDQRKGRRLEREKLDEMEAQNYAAVMEKKMRKDERLGHIRLQRALADPSQPFLSLPAPQVDNDQIGAIAKTVSETQRLNTGQFTVSGQTTPSHTGMLTGRTQFGYTPQTGRKGSSVGVTSEYVMNEARDVAALMTTSTPLLGGLNTPLHHAGFDFEVDREQIAMGDLDLARKLATPRRSAPGETAMGEEDELMPPPMLRINENTIRKKARGEYAELDALFEALPEPTKPTKTKEKKTSSAMTNEDWEKLAEEEVQNLLSTKKTKRLTSTASENSRQVIPPKRHKPEPDELSKPDEEEGMIEVVSREAQMEEAQIVKNEMSDETLINRTRGVSGDVDQKTQDEIARRKKERNERANMSSARLLNDLPLPIDASGLEEWKRLRIESDQSRLPSLLGMDETELRTITELVLSEASILIRHDISSTAKPSRRRNRQEKDEQSTPDELEEIDSKWMEQAKLQMEEECQKMRIEVPPDPSLFSLDSILSVPPAQATHKAIMDAQEELRKLRQRISKLKEQAPVKQTPDAEEDERQRRTRLEQRLLELNRLNEEASMKRSVYQDIAELEQTKIIPARLAQASAQVATLQSIENRFQQEFGTLRNRAISLRTKILNHGSISNISRRTQGQSSAQQGVTYICGDCGSQTHLMPGKPVSCSECGNKILYKKRTQNVIQVEAR